MRCNKKVRFGVDVMFYIENYFERRIRLQDNDIVSPKHSVF